MAKSYKLSEEIMRFIVEQKTMNPNLSCRGLVPLIKEKFQVNISKSLINNIIKKENLSSPIGRKSTRKQVVSGTPMVKSMISDEIEFMENGGYFFLKAADLKSGLTLSLAQRLSPYFSHFSAEILREMVEASMYLPFFKSKKSLWFLIGKELTSESLTQYSQALAQIPDNQAKEALSEGDFNLNINKINELHNQCLFRLNTYAQESFFPSVYQILSFAAMRERFYSLSARIKNKPGLCEIQLFSTPAFQWRNDIIWHEDFSYAVNKVNSAQIFTPGKAQLWISPLPLFQDEKPLSYL